MSAALAAVLAPVLAGVEARVAYLRAAVGAGGDGWLRCDTLDPGDLRAAIDAGVAARKCSRQVAASLLAQSYAFKVGAVSLAAYAIGLPWPSPGAASTAVQLRNGRASGLSYAADVPIGALDDAVGLARALLAEHLDGFVDRVHTATAGDARLGHRLVTGNLAASCAAALRAVEGAARDRGDQGERDGVRRRAAAFFDAARPWLAGAGRFETVSAGTADGWFWTRTSCCLWYQASASTPATCDDCSLIPAAELEQRRRAEVEEARA